MDNQIPEVLRDFAIQTDRLISAGRLDLVIVKKKKKEHLPNSIGCRPTGPALAK